MYKNDSNILLFITLFIMHRLFLLYLESSTYWKMIIIKINYIILFEPILEK